MSLLEYHRLKQQRKDRWSAILLSVWTFTWQLYAWYASLFLLLILLGIGDPAYCFDFYRLLNNFKII